jgi:hypothetical protein
LIVRSPIVSPRVLPGGGGVKFGGFLTCIPVQVTKNHSSFIEQGAKWSFVRHTLATKMIADCVDGSGPTQRKHMKSPCALLLHPIRNSIKIQKREASGMVLFRLIFNRPIELLVAGSIHDGEHYNGEPRAHSRAPPGPRDQGSFDEDQEWCVCSCLNLPTAI